MDINSNSREPMLTIVSISYNHEPYLRQALESVVMQKTDFPFEMIIGEDCSPDNSRTILREYETKYPHIFTVVYRDENIGGGRNIYDIYQRVRSKYITVLETDDFYTDPLKLQKQIDFLESHSEYYGVAHDYQTVDEEGLLLEQSNATKRFLGRPFTIEDMQNHAIPAHTATRVFRNFMLDGGDEIIKKDISVMSGEHGTLAMVLAYFGNIFILNDNMTAHRIIERHGSTSWKSSFVNDRAGALYKHFFDFRAMQKCLDNKLLLDMSRVRIVLTYATSCIKRKAGFEWTKLAFMIKHIDIYFSWRLIKFVFSYPFRKYKRNRLLPEEGAL